MRIKNRIFMFVFWALIATTTMLTPQDQVKKTRVAVLEVYTNILDAGEINCDNRKDVLKLIEVYRILTNMDKEASDQEKKSAAESVEYFRKTSSSQCSDGNSQPYETVTFISKGIGIRIKKEIPTFVYSMYFMPDSLKAKYLSNLPEDQKNFAETWQEKNVEVNQLMKLEFENELNRYEPTKYDQLLKEYDECKTQIQNLEKNLNNQLGNIKIEKLKEKYQRNDIR